MAVIDQTSDLLIEANNLFDQRRLSDAMIKFKEVLKQDPFNAEASYKCGLIQTELENESEAIFYYEKAISIDPNFSPAYTNLGLVYSKKENYQKALEYFDKVIKLTPKDPVALNYYGNTLLYMEKYDEAINYYIEAINIDHNYIYPIYNWGLALEKKGDKETAILKYKDVLNINPEYLPALKNLALIYASTKKSEQAIEVFSSITKVKNASNYDIADAFNNWGNIYYDKRDYSSAIEKYKEAINVDRQFLYAYHNLGLCFLNQEKFIDAIKYFNYAIEINDKYIESHRYLGQAYIEINDYDHAVESFETVLKLNPTYEVIQSEYAIALSGAKKYVESLIHFKKGIKSNPEKGINSEALSRTLKNVDNRIQEVEEIQKIVDDLSIPDLYNDWGNTFYYMGEYDTAIEQYQKTIKLKKDFVYSYHNWGLCLEALEEYENSIIQFNKALEIDPNYVNSYNYLGVAYFKLKKFDESIIHFKKALEILPGFTAALLNYGNSLLKLGNFNEAVNRYIEAIESNPDDGFDSDKLFIAIANCNDPVREIKNIQKIIDKQNNYKVYYYWGNTLSALQKYPDAIKQYEKANYIEPSCNTYHNIGLAYFNLKQYKEAEDEFKRAIELKTNYASAYYNYAYLLAWKGDYKSATSMWKKAATIYELTSDKADEENDSNHFLFYGDIIHSVLKQYEKAEKIYNRGLEIDPENYKILINLINLNLDYKNYIKTSDDEYNSKKNIAHWNALEYFNMGKRILTSLTDEADEKLNFLFLGDLYLMTADYEEAEKCYLKALEVYKNSSNVYDKLGVLYMRLEDYKNAIRNFESALKYEPDDLNLQSNLAEAYMRADILEKAESLYHKVLEVSPFHIESIIGLGEVYTTMGENDDPDMFLAAQNYFTKAIKYSKSEHNSKKLKNNELAAVYYSRGYCCVKAFESAKFFSDNNLLNQAREDFKSCYDLNHDNYKAQRAVEKIEKRFGYNSVQWLTEKAGPKVIFFISLFFLMVAQFAFFVGKPVLTNKEYTISQENIDLLQTKNLPVEVINGLNSLQGYSFKDRNQFLELLKTGLGEENFNKFKPIILDNISEGITVNSFQPIETGYYILLTFGSILFMITGLYLPQLLKLKVGGIELEKSSVDQIKSSSPLSIGKINFTQTASFKMGSVSQEKHPPTPQKMIKQEPTDNLV